MKQPSVLGQFVLKVPTKFKAIIYHGPGRLKEIEEDVGFRYDSDGETPIIYDDGSIEIENGNYIDQEDGFGSQPEYIDVLPGEVIIIPLDVRQNAYKITKEEFDKLYESV